MAKLPNEYQEVEYIETTGTQYIDIGFVPTLNTEIKCKFNTLTVTNNTEMLFGCKNVSSQYYQVYKTTGKGRVIWGSPDTQHQNDFTISSDQDVIFTINKNNFIVNDTTYTYAATPSVDGYNSLCIFARHNPSDVSSYGSFKMYYFKVYENNALVLNLVPCYRKSDNIAGMYDLVSKTFLTNQGTGDFTVGPDIPSSETFIYTTGEITINGKKYTATKADYSTYKTSTGTIKIDNKDYTATKVYGE